MRYYYRNIHSKLNRFLLAFIAFFVISVYFLTVYAISEKSFSDFYVNKINQFDSAMRTINAELTEVENRCTKITSNSYIADIIRDDYENDMFKNHNVHAILNMYFSSFIDKETASINNLKVYTNNEHIYEGRFVKSIKSMPPEVSYEDLKDDEQIWVRDDSSVSLYKKFLYSDEKNTLILCYTVSYSKFSNIISEFAVTENQDINIENILLFNEEPSAKQVKKNYVISDKLLSGDKFSLLLPKKIKRIIFTDKAIVIFPMVILFLAVMSGLSMFITKKLTDNLNKFIDYISINEDLTELRNLDIDENDDMYPVHKRIVSLIEQVNTLHTEINSIEKEKNIIENRYIYAQINPHLLYNALSVLKWKCMDFNTDLANAIDMMSDYFRKSINFGSDEITFAEEIELVRRYVSLMNFIKDKKYTLEIDFDDELLSRKTIRHIFQPLVENSILHGIRHRDNGNILIKGTVKNNITEIIIKDNGVGIPADKLKQINLFSYGSKYNSFGIKNTMLRLKLFYNSQSGITIDSAPGEGTTVTIKIYQ